MTIALNNQTPRLAGLGLVDRLDVANMVAATLGLDSFPSTALTQFGGGAANTGDAGMVNVQVSAAGVQPGATGADNVLAVYSLPASSLNAAGKGLTIVARGSFGATGNNKTLKIIFNPSAAVVGSTVTGGTTIASTGVVTTNGGGWTISANVFKYGTAGSNTQIGVSSAALTTAPALLTATESGVILIAVTGNAATAASDIVFNLLTVEGYN